MRIQPMLTVRQRIALWCIGLSTFVYITPTIFGFFFFYYRLTGALDHELRTLASSLGHAVELESGKPHFRDWARVVQTDPARSLTTILLYDANGKLLERYGVPGIDRLILNQSEFTEGDKTMRVTVTPLIAPGDKKVGYLQFEIPTKERDAAVRQFAWVMVLIAPIVLAGLGICSYFVSDKATVPIQQTIDLLRQFISDAGHELNTPLSIVNACAEALEHKLSKQGIEAKEIATISSSSERMQSIIDDLMLLSELETPLKGDRTREAISVTKLVDECTNKFSIKFEQKGVALRTTIAGGLNVVGDRFELQTLLNNLIENALRYTDAGGAVELTVAATGPAEFQITVSDNGIGIPTESLPLIFNRFYRVDKSRSRSSGGSGLGLSIVKAIAESHRGSVTVSSTQGAGTKFTVNLPLII
jgi:signal transduction histidine kinase